MRNALFAAAMAVLSAATIVPQADAAGTDKAPAASDAAGDVSLGSAQARLGFRLLQKLAGDRPSPDVVLDSPASVAAVLAFLDLAADAGMHHALVNALGFDLAESATALDSLRNSAGELAAAPPGQGPLAFANALFVDPAGMVRPAALAKLVAAGVEAREAPLGEQAGIDAVNGWVSQHTAGLIPSIIDQPLVDAVLVAVNALHFKDRWSDPFDSRSTIPLPFHLVEGGTVDLPMMRRALRDPLLRQDGHFIGVTLRYRTEGYSLTVVTTKGEPAALAGFAPVAGWLAGDSFGPAGRVDLSLPKFDASWAADLLPALKEMGLGEGFSGSAFAALSEKPVTISAVLQKTVIKVDESGTEAAAATAVIAPAAALPSPEHPIEVKVDKPFIFALRDDRHGLILLAGYVGHPASR